MRIKYAELDAQLRQKLALAYVIVGDEPLQVLEGADLVRRHAKQQGFVEREVFNVDSGFDWENFLSASATLSLFATRKIIELRLPNSGKLNDKAKNSLAEYFINPSPDNVLLITGPKLDSETLRAKWFSAIEQHGVIVQVWPIDHDALPNWIMRRVRAIGFSIDPEAAQYLAEHVEGNLLAAAQEIDKLILNTNQKIELAQVVEAVADSTQFDVYDLVDAGLSAQKARIYRIINGLRDGGTEPLHVLWALSRELRILSQCAYIKSSGGNVQSVFKQERVFAKHEPIIQRALQSRPVNLWRKLLRRAARIDRVIKGMDVGNPWDELLNLCLMMSGTRLFRVEA